jgi:hypothetical protein
MPNFRAVPRYFLLPPLYARFGDHVASVVDLSLKGARLEVVKPLPLGGRFALTIETHRGVIEVPASVLWCQIDDLSITEAPDRYLVGLAFEEASHDLGELLERLLHAHLAVPIEDARNFDRFRITARLTGALGTVAPVGIMDLSIRGARVALPHFVPFGSTHVLQFQVDEETGPVLAEATVVWCLGAEGSGFEGGLKIEGHEDKLRLAIHRLCMRDEARIDLHSLRRRFDSMRALSHQYSALAAS